MKKPLFKSYLLKIGAPLVALAPIAVVVACHKTGKIELLKVEAKTENLANITTSGDTRNVTFEIPKELEYVSAQNVLDPDGTTKAFQVLIKATLKIGSSSLAINNSYMPSELLSHYLSGKLSYQNGTLVAKLATGDISVQKTFGGTYGFTAQNIAVINNNTQVGEWTSTFEAKYQALGAFIPIDKAELTKVAQVPVDSLKTYVSLATPESELTAFSAKIAYTTDSDNGTVAWKQASITKADLPPSWSAYVDSVKFSLSNPSTKLESISWSSSRPTSFPPITTDRYLLMQLVPTNGYVLSTDFIDLTQLSKVRDLVLKIDSLPEYAALDLSKVDMRASKGALLIDDSKVTLPPGTKIEYQIGSGTFYEKDLFIAEVKKATTLSKADINVHLASTDFAKYKLAGDKKTKPNVSTISGFVDTTAFFTTLTADLKVDLAASLPTSLVWSGVPSTLPTAVAAGGARIEYLAGNYVNESDAVSATTWSTTPPLAIDPTWRDYSFWARVVPKDNYLFNKQYLNLSTTSGLKSVVPDTNIDALKQQAETLTVANTSTHDVVTWTKTLSIPTALVSMVENVEYASGNYATEAALAGVTWSATLPTSVAFNHNDRHLWIRVNPKPGFKFAQRIFDLTRTSQITTVKSKVDLLPTYAAIDLAKVKISGAVTGPTIDASQVSIPSSAKITYSFRTSGWLDSGPIVSYIVNASSTIITTDFNQIFAHLETSDPALYVVSGDKRKAIDGSGLTISSSSLPGDLVTALNGFKVQTTSTHDAVSWAPIPALPSSVSAQVASLQYAYGDFSSRQDMISKAVWVDNLPTSVAFSHSARSVWVKVIPATGYTFADPYYNITSTSDIRSVKSKVDALPGYSSISLSGITVGGSIGNITVNVGTVTVPDTAKITYQFKAGAWTDSAGLISAVNALGTSLTQADLDTINVHIEPKDTGLYVVVNDRATKPTVSVTITITSGIPAALETALKALRVETSSNHTSVFWNNTPPSATQYSSVQDIKFLSGEYTTQATAEAAAQNLWSLTLPSSVDFTHNKRNLWVRVTPRTGYVFSNQYLNITDDTNIRKVLSRVDSDANYSQIDLTKITLSGTSTTPVVNESVISTSLPTMTLPRGAKITYQIKSGSWISATALASYITTNAGTLTPLDLVGIRAHLESDVDTLYVVNNPKEAVITSSLVLVVTPSTDEISNIKIAGYYLGGSHVAARWYPSSTWNPLTSTYIQSVSYLYLEDKNYADTDFTGVQAASESSWKASAPTTVAADYNLRNLWVRMNPKPGYSFTTPVFNVTGDSAIRGPVWTSLDSVNAAQFNGFTSTIALIGTRSNPVITVTNSKVLPDYTVLRITVYISRANGTLSGPTADSIEEAQDIIRNMPAGDNLSDITAALVIPSAVSKTNAFHGSILIDHPATYSYAVNKSGFTA